MMRSRSNAYNKHFSVDWMCVIFHTDFLHFLFICNSFHRTRFDKCISVGMEKSWVMSEEERLQLLRTRLQRKQAEQKQQSTSVSSNKIAGSTSAPTMSPVCSSSPSALSGPTNTTNNRPGAANRAYIADYALIYQHLQRNEVNAHGLLEKWRTKVLIVQLWLINGDHPDWIRRTNGEQLSVLLRSHASGIFGTTNLASLADTSSAKSIFGRSFAQSHSSGSWIACVSTVLLVRSSIHRLCSTFCAVSTTVCPWPATVVAPVRSWTELFASRFQLRFEAIRVHANQLDVVSRCHRTMERPLWLRTAAILIFASFEWRHDGRCGRRTRRTRVVLQVSTALVTLWTCTGRSSRYAAAVAWIAPASKTDALCACSKRVFGRRTNFVAVERHFVAERRTSRSSSSAAGQRATRRLCSPAAKVHAMEAQSWHTRSANGTFVVDVAGTAWISRTVCRLPARTVATTAPATAAASSFDRSQTIGRQLQHDQQHRKWQRVRRLWVRLRIAFRFASRI